MPDPEPTPTPQPEPKPTQTFSPEYVHELREENKAWRLKAQGHETEATKQKQAAAEVATAAEAKITEAQAQANERIVRAEVKAAAVRAGMVDVDAIKMLDLSAIKLDDAGDVQIPADFFDKVKAAKPYLFGGTSTSSTSTPPPKPGPGDAPKHVRDMTADERKAAAKAAGISISA